MQKKLSNNIVLDKIKITFEYNNKKVSFDAEPYQTLKTMKNKAINLFFPCPPNLQCFYLNKDISSNEIQQVGVYFQDKKTVLIKLKSSSVINTNKKHQKKLTSSLIQSKNSEENHEIMNDRTYKKILAEIQEEEKNNKLNSNKKKKMTTSKIISDDDDVNNKKKMTTSKIKSDDDVHNINDNQDNKIEHTNNLLMKNKLKK